MPLEMPKATDVVLRYLLERNATDSPAATAVTFEQGQSWTWQDAVTEMYRGADAIRRHGITQDARVALIAPNGDAFLRAWWGANALGATLVPLNLAYKGTILQHALDVAAPELIVVDPAYRTVLDDAKFDAAVCEIGELAEGEAETPPLERPLDTWDIGLIVFTSGTTGPSKASLTTNYQTLLTTSWFAEGWALGPDDRFLIDLPLFHLAAQSMAVSSIAARASLAVRTAPALSRYWAAAKDAQVTASALVSTMAPFLAAQPESPADRDHDLRVILCVPLVAEFTRFQARFGVDLATSFGGTEASGPIVRTPAAPLVAGSCGRLRPGYEVRLVDDHDIEVPDGQPGELIVRTDAPWMMSAGYLGDGDATARAWRNGWFHTGDALRRDPDGNFFFHDRLKDTLRRRGENVSSFEVEREVLAHPGVAEAACVAVPSDHGTDDEVKVFVVFHDAGSPTMDELLRFLVERMPYFMVPRYYESIAAMPKTPTMRIQKHALRRLGNGPDTWDAIAHGYKVTKGGLVRT